MSTHAATTAHVLTHANMAVMSTRRDQQPMFAFRLKEHAAKVVRDKMAAEAISAQALMETLACAWATGRLTEDVRELRAEIIEEGGLL